ncbi:hypothetical protein PtrSN002B_012058 [Pyrenophora tritici-repentis]|uniref:Uncharacterized protein n=2 Tax=Pyrenophora tritici-repentis TaxID=45151 RepID=A0A2W1F7D7_9PLEO|nr:uncharacterized protein PTRG_08339 [Pyrenophora tritici-repentis Pt-1C-BFP]KAA8615713.1 hypothetical protein PtrV1_11109 [Pyrenophora tritici-repentis]EDU51258.1 predicted protein [Pyrenophora tritici-repentis Pt-1C-BFP]KAF7443700.1 hypothetical protein A1F99_117740 [Pyrenophora tritici-repentis]KAF7566577.1 hypothetical protein PtrM4_148970 [Pyrenophora tritici-repentis]KAG9379439.1 hypothetical protein A1F94_009795 [Pyrenophora tritici-repentis]
MNPSHPPYPGTAAHPESFGKRIADPSIEVIVGNSPNVFSWNLPIALLSSHSIFFAKEIARLNAIRTDKVANKK